MVDGASRKCHLAPDIFLSLFSTTNSPQQSPGILYACQTPSEIVSLVISALRKHPFEVGVSPMRRRPINIIIGCPSAPKCRWTTCLKNRRTLLTRSFKCLDTISKTRLLEVLQDPRKPLGLHRRELENCLSRMLLHYGLQYHPPPHPPTPSRREKSVPLGFWMVAVSQAKMDAFNQFMADLLVISLLFCLRSFDYTNTNYYRCTTQFRFQDMQFYGANGVIPPNAATNVFLSASTITLFLGTQKNCVCRESSTMEDTGLLHGDPFPACARRYLHHRKNNAPPDTPTCTYYAYIGAAPKSVTRGNIVELLRATAKQIGFQWLGFFHTRLVLIP